MIFPFLVAFSINKDYSDKTGQFYRMMGINSLKYWLIKIGTLTLELLFCILVYNLIISLIYLDFSATVQMTFLFMLVSICIFCTVGLLSMIFQSLIFAIGSSLAYWILGILLVQVGGVLKYIAFFDASSTFYITVRKYLSSNKLFIENGFWNPVIFTVVVISLCAVLCWLINKRFFRQGVTG
jgi:putative peptide transport system permease protein